MAKAISCLGLRVRACRRVMCLSQNLANVFFREISSLTRMPRGDLDIEMALAINELASFLNMYTHGVYNVLQCPTFRLIFTGCPTI